MKGPEVAICRYKPYIKEFLRGKDCYPVFKEISDSLKSLGATYWVASGTLLGLFRDKGFIPNDTDIDFDIYDFDPDRLPDLGRRLKTCTDTKGVTYQKCFLCGPNIIIDLYFYRMDGDVIYSYNGNKRLEHPKSILNLTDFEFNGEKFPCPDPETYLTRMYGDWRTPARKKSEWKQQSLSG